MKQEVNFQGVRALTWTLYELGPVQPFPYWTTVSEDWGLTLYHLLWPCDLY